MARMNRKTLALALLAASTTLGGAPAPEGFAIWKGSELREAANQLSPKIKDANFIVEPLAEYANHRLIIVHREGDGPAELHETSADFYVVQSGEATLLVGGEVVDPKTTDPGEVRGASIRGGTKTKMGVGDVVNIPAKIPHQVLVETGKKVTYLIVKITE